MSEEDRNKLFNPFSRTNVGTTDGWKTCTKPNRNTRMQNKAVTFSLCLILSACVAAAAVAVTKEYRQRTYEGIFHKATEDLENELSTYTIYSQLMGAVMTMGLNQPEIKHAALKRYRSDEVVAAVMEALALVQFNGTPRALSINGLRPCLVGNTCRLPASWCGGYRVLGANVVELRFL